MESGQAQGETGKVVNEATNEQFSISTYEKGLEVKRTPVPKKKGKNSKS